MFKAIKRITSDLDELIKEPVYGISILIQQGIYKDMLIHVIIHLSQDYQ